MQNDPKAKPAARPAVRSQPRRPYNRGMGVENRLVTLSGECFEAQFEGEERHGPRPGTLHLFRLRDMRSRRG
jgi:hypothetical protein